MAALDPHGLAAVALNRCAGNHLRQGDDRMSTTLTKMTKVEVVVGGQDAAGCAT